MRQVALRTSERCCRQGGIPCAPPLRAVQWGLLWCGRRAEAEGRRLKDNLPADPFSASGENVCGVARYANRYETSHGAVSIWFCRAHSRVDLELTMAGASVSFIMLGDLTWTLVCC